MKKQSSNLQPLGYATFIQRTHAFFIDCLVFIPITSLAQFNMSQGKNFNIVVLVTLAWLIYKPVMEWKYGATLGKMVAKIRVVDDAMQFPSFDQSMMRFLPYFAVALAGLLFNYALFNTPGFHEAKTIEDLQNLQGQLPSGTVLISYFFYVFSISRMFFNEKKQTFHDQFSHTYCILVERNTEGDFQNP